MATTTTPLDHRVDADLKREFDKTAEGMGITPTAALTVFMKRLVSGEASRLPSAGPSRAMRCSPPRWRCAIAGCSRGRDTEHGLVEA